MYSFFWKYVQTVLHIGKHVSVKSFIQLVYYPGFVGSIYLFSSSKPDIIFGPILFVK